MGELAARAEVIKLARELSADPDSIAFLQSAPDETVAQLRRTITHALYAMHEPRLRRVASLSKLLPPPLSAKIAELALGPMLSGRIAGVLDVASAVRLAEHLKPAFLAEVSKWIDPDRTRDIVRSLPDDLVVRVARELLAAGEHMVLGRFVAVVDDRVARQVIEMSSGAQLLETSFYAEDRHRLDDLIRHVDDERLVDVVRAAAEGDHFDEAVSLLVFLGPSAQERLSRTLHVLGPDVADGVVAAIVSLDAWLELLPVVGDLPDETVRLIVNVPTMLDPQVVGRLIREVRERADVVDQARKQGYFARIVDLVEALDDGHRAVLTEVGELDDPAVRAWAAEAAGVAPQVIDAAIHAFRSGEPLPEDLVRALGDGGRRGAVRTS